MGEALLALRRILKAAGCAVSVALIARVVQVLLKMRHAQKHIDNMAHLVPLGIPKEKLHLFFGALFMFKSNFERMYHFRKQLFDSARIETKSLSNGVGNDKPVDSVVMAPSFFSRFVFSSAPPMILFSRDPKVVKFILKDKFDCFVKSKTIRTILRDLLGDGIFVIRHGTSFPDEHATWSFQRKTASRIFTRSVFNGHVKDVMTKNLNKLLRNIDTKLDGKNENVIDVKHQIYCFALDSIGDIGFGVDLDTLGKDGAVPFSECFDDAVVQIGHRQMRPMWNLLGGRLYEGEAKLQEDVDVLDKFATSVISERKSDQHLEEKGDILSLFLQANGDLSHEFLKDVVMSFMIAGRDTTSCTISFALYLLATHPEKQKKVFEEIKEKLGEIDSGNIQATLEMTKDMPYLSGVVLESLRLYPPVPTDAKQATCDMVLPNGAFIPAGAIVAFEIFVMGHDESRYKDAEKFAPERWLPEPNEKFDEYAFPVFQGGPRICLGKDLALYEAKMFLIEFLKRYSVSTADDYSEVERGERMIYRAGITLSFKGPLNLTVTKRKET